MSSSEIAGADGAGFATFVRDLPLAIVLNFNGANYIRNSIAFEFHFVSTLYRRGDRFEMECV